MSIYYMDEKHTLRDMPSHIILMFIPDFQLLHFSANTNNSNALLIFYVAQRFALGVIGQDWPDSPSLTSRRGDGIWIANAVRS